MKFDKMHGLGNDFVLIDISKNKLGQDDIVRLCTRKFGIGCDTLVTYYVESIASLVVEFFNADGTKAEVCGNALRCIGLLMLKKFSWDKCHVKACNKSYDISVRDDMVLVNMGEPSFDNKLIGLAENVDPKNVSRELSEILNIKVDAACISLGNPHVVFFTPIDIEHVGKLLSHHPFFKYGINVSSARVHDDNIELCVYERGVGLTLACGSAACSAAYLAWMKGLVQEHAVVHQQGGDLEVSIFANHIIQRGSANYVFSGEITL